MMNGKFIIFIIIIFFCDITVVNAGLEVSGPFQYFPVTVCPDSAVSSKTILDVLNEDIRFSEFKNYVDLVEMTALLSGNEAITVFAPANEAYAHLSNDEKEYLTHNNRKIKDMIESLILEGCLKLEYINEKTRFKSLYGKLVVDPKSKKIYVNDAEVIISGIVCKNGILYGIDRIPPIRTPADYETGVTEVVGESNTTV